MTARIACKIVIEIGMGVEVEDIEWAVDCGKRGYDGRADRMIASENQWHCARLDRNCNSSADCGIVALRCG